MDFHEILRMCRLVTTEELFKFWKIRVRFWRCLSYDVLCYRVLLTITCYSVSHSVLLFALLTAKSVINLRVRVMVHAARRKRRVAWRRYALYRVPSIFLRCRSGVGSQPLEVGEARFSEPSQPGVLRRCVDDTQESCGSVSVRRPLDAGTDSEQR